MGRPSYDHDFWENLWSKTLREHADKVSKRPPNVHLLGEAKQLRPGRAVDAGCGHGAESLWLAAHGWRVTAVDFSIAALEHARSTAEAAGPELAGRIDFVQADLGSWAPDVAAYDLVVSLYVHVAGSVEEAVGRLARGVAPGGTLFLVGHQPLDPTTGAPTAAAAQNQVSLDAPRSALPLAQWDLTSAELRPRSAGSGVDAVVSARRKGCGVTRHGISWRLCLGFQP